MKIITLTQPWATLVAIGAKVYETRSWSTKYRGDVAIHAAKGMDAAAMVFAETGIAASVLGEHGYHQVSDLPRGAIVSVVDLVGCLPTANGFDETFRLASGALLAAGAGSPSLEFPPMPARLERYFGNYEPGRFAWATRNLRRLREPLPWTGGQGLRDLAPVAAVKVLELVA